jgi:16S rRNA (guanine966-N2)-methyltransferase
MSVRILSGRFKGSVLVVPCSARPTLVRSRQSLFDILSGFSLSSKNPRSFFENKIVLDCFAGSGALGIEAMSRGASFSYFVDISQIAINSIYENVQKLNLENHCRILKTNILKIKKFSGDNQCDIVFVDPPYGKISIKKTIEHLYNKKWINESSLIITEEDFSHVEDLSSIANSLVERKIGGSFFRIISLVKNYQASSNKMVNSAYFPRTDLQ